MEKIPLDESKITLNDFLEMWWDRDLPVAIMDFEDMDDLNFADIKTIDDIENENIIPFTLAGISHYRPSVYLTERYAFARVKAFRFVGAWCVVGIGEYHE